MRLAETAISAGFTLEFHERLGSTNDRAMALAREGGSSRRWVAALEQSGGRGRHGRVWASPPGNLYASLLLLDPCEPADAPRLGFLAGVALHEAIARAGGTALPALKLKWPNDLVIGRAKFAGILVEGRMLASGGPLAVVIGIGVNISSHPADTIYPATDLSAEGVAVDAARLFEALSAAMTRRLHGWRRGVGFAAIRAAWLARAAGLGEPIIARRPNGERRGVFVDLDPQGRLLLQEPGLGVTAIEAGDVFPVDCIERSA